MLFRSRSCRHLAKKAFSPPAPSKSEKSYMIHCVPWLGGLFKSTFYLPIAHCATFEGVLERSLGLGYLNGRGQHGNSKVANFLGTGTRFSFWSVMNTHDFDEKIDTKTSIAVHRSS